MLNFLHNFNPQPVLVSLGPIHIYWYGFFIVLGILAAIQIAFSLNKYYQLPKDVLFDLFFWLIIGGLAGARLYDVLLELPYYIDHPLQILKIWQGGLAIHGAIISGLIIIFIFKRRYRLNFWKLTALIVPGLALAQSLGRWGNYFNQELFGRPTISAWGIPISLLNRPAEYITSGYFQPTFLYESMGCFLIFIILITVNIYLLKKNRLNSYFYVWSTALYMLLYSILRFSLEFIRLDNTPHLFSWRWPQIISLIIMILAIVTIIFNSHAQKQKDNRK